MSVSDYDDLNVAGCVEDLDRILSLVKHLESWSHDAQFHCEVEICAESDYDTQSALGIWLQSSHPHIKHVRSALARCHGIILECVGRMEHVEKSFPRNTTKEPL